MLDWKFRARKKEGRKEKETFLPGYIKKNQEFKNKSGRIKVGAPNPNTSYAG
jgi:hypothetical protein